MPSYHRQLQHQAGRGRLLHLQRRDDLFESCMGALKIQELIMLDIMALSVVCQQKSHQRQITMTELVYQGDSLLGRKG